MAEKKASDDTFAREVLFDLERLGDDADRVFRDMCTRGELFDMGLRRLKFALRDLAKRARGRAGGEIVTASDATTDTRNGLSVHSPKKAVRGG